MPASAHAERGHTYARRRHCVRPRAIQQRAATHLRASRIRAHMQSAVPREGAWCSFIQLLVNECLPKSKVK